MKRKLLAIVLSVVLILSITPLGAFTVGAETEGLFTYTVSNGAATITGLTDHKYAGDLTIPDTISGYPVTSIAEFAFGFSPNITSITIGRTVTSIGAGPFCYGENALESINVDSNNTFYHSANNCLIETRSKKLIQGCKNSVIPSDGSVTSIRYGAFYGCVGLTSISIPDSVTSIGDSAFACCTALTHIIIHSSVTSIGGTTFECCLNLKTAGPIGGGYNIELGWEDTIPKFAFGELNTLTHINIPNGITSICEYAFVHCSYLTSIVIPESVVSIGEVAFRNGSKLTDVYYIGTEATKSNISISKGNDALTNATWHYNCNPENPTCEHTETEIKNSVAATCTSDGYTGYTTCAECGWLIDAGETIPALGHNYQAVVTAPTCTEQGYTTHTCSRCGDSYVDTYTSPLNHSRTELKNYVAATCTEDGYSGDTYCSDCGICLSYGTTIPTHGHDLHLYNETPPTCTDIGFTGFWLCEICNKRIIIGEDIPALGHDYIAVVTPPTCMHGGYTTHTCSRCGDSYVNEYTAPTGHQCDNWVITKNATCTVEGQRVGSCKFCGIEMEEVIPTIAHAYDAWRYETLPSCENSGKIICTCLLCGDKKTITIDALGHEYSAAWTVDSEPTCTAAGHKSHHCIRCDAVSDSTEIPANGHQYTSVTVNPTCTKGGYTQHICSVCGSSYKTDIVSASGHTFTHYAAQAPTCTEAGWNEYDTCDICGYTTYEEIDAFGHDYQAVGNGYVCSHCGAVIENAQTEEHHYIKTIVKPTADSDGYTQYTCTDCGYYYRTDVTHFESGAKFAISDAVVGASKKVILTVSISNNPGIYSFSLGVSYDKSAMTLTGINNLNKLPGDLSLGVDKVLWLNNNHVNSTFNGGVFQLEFDVSAHAVSQDYTVTLTYTPGDIVNYGLDDVNLAIEPGTVTVEGFSAGDLNGDGVCNNKDLVLMSEIYARNYTAYKAGKAHTESNRVKGYNLFGSLGMNLIKNVEIVVLGITIERVALDINNDGIINNYDLLTMMKYLRGEEVEIY